MSVSRNAPEITVWRTTALGGEVYVRTFRWRWLARLYAWEHTKRGWFRYRVRALDREDA